MPLTIDMLTLGPVQTNCYLVGDEQTRQAVLIDPADNAPVIMEQVQERGYAVLAILITHGHFDHVLAAAPLQKSLSAPLYIHPDAVEGMQNAGQTAARFGMSLKNFEAATPEHFLHGGEQLSFGPLNFEVRLAPGHAPGHLIFYLKAHHIAFVGDVIFRNGIGRTDLPKASAAQLKESIIRELLPLPDETVLLSGHGPQTTLGAEKQSNYYLKMLLED